VLPRRAAVVAAALLAAAVSSPGPAQAADDAATVNDASISVDDFEQSLQELGAGELVAGDEGRAVLGVLVLNELTRQFLVNEGVDVSEVSGTFQEQQAAYETLVAEADVEVPDGLSEEYESTGGAAGLVCIRLFAVEDADAGDEAMTAIAEGDEFDEVGAANDPGFEQTGGSITGEADQPCVRRAELNPAADPIVAAVTEGEPGTPVGPVETEVGLFVVMAPPFSDVRRTLAPLVARDDFVTASDITINPRYGRWDAATASVVPLGQE
jgi:hypothetical protein